MSTHPTRTLLLALSILGVTAFASPADAATNRWHDITYTPTYNDGLALTGASFDGYRIVSSVAIPFFKLNGVRYELTEDLRVSEPTMSGTPGEMIIEASYEVPVRGGIVAITVSHELRDSDPQYQDLGEISSWASFNGPEGDYSFFWRIDPDLRGAAGDRVQVYTEAGSRGYWAASPLEQAVELNGVLEFHRFKIRFNDGPDYADQTQLRLAPPSEGWARAYIVAAAGSEWELEPATLVNHQRIQEVQVGELVPQPIVGSDLVLWYETRIQGSSGVAGPSLYASTASDRQAVIEIDRMDSTEYPPATVPHQGDMISMESAFGAAGITINRIFYEGVMPDQEGIALSEMDAIMEANSNLQATQDTPTQWYSWFGVAKTLIIPGVLGVMYDTSDLSSDDAYREGAFALYDSIEEIIPLLEQVGYPPQDFDQYFIWTATHETGHTYNQHHEDFWYDETSCFYENTSIMGYAYDVANHLFWDFGPNSSASMRGGDPDEYVRPGHGVDFMRTEGPFLMLNPYNVTRTHLKGHNRTNLFTGGGCEW